MKTSALTHGMRVMAEQCRDLDVPADPFEQADVLEAAHRLGASLVELVQRIWGAQREFDATYSLEDRLRLTRSPYPPDDPPPPEEPPPPPDPKGQTS